MTKKEFKKIHSENGMWLVGVNKNTFGATTKHLNVDTTPFRRATTKCDVDSSNTSLHTFENQFGHYVIAESYYIITDSNICDEPMAVIECVVYELKGDNQ